MMIMLLEFLIVPAALIALVVWAGASLRGGKGPATQDEAPLEILGRRYASDEISQDEFEQARVRLYTLKQWHNERTL